MLEGKKARSIYLDEEDSDNLEKLAKEDNRSFNSYVNILFKKHLEEHNKLSLVKRKKVA